MKELFTINLTKCNQEGFISFWSKLYSYKLEENYNSCIDKTQFSKDDVEKLFIWKNGGNLSRKKKNGFVKFIQTNLEIVNQLKNKFDEAIFEETFGGRTTIWQIFLKHIIKPQQFPIFDQNVYRAFIFIEKGEISELPENDKDKLEIYKRDYLPFFNQFTFKNKKKIDEALFVFGDFLKVHSRLFVGKIEGL